MRVCPVIICITCIIVERRAKKRATAAGDGFIFLLKKEELLLEEMNRKCVFMIHYVVHVVVCGICMAALHNILPHARKQAEQHF